MEANASLYDQKQMRSRLLAASTLVAASSVGLVMAVGCRSLPASKPEALWTMEEARGAQVFHQNCAKCHYPTNTH